LVSVAIFGPFRLGGLFLRAFVLFAFLPGLRAGLVFLHRFGLFFYFGSAAAAELLDTCVDDADELAQGSGEERDDRAQRADDRPEHLALENVRRRQGCQAAHLVGAHRLTLQNPALEAQDLRLASRVVERLGDGDHVSLADEGDRGRAVEQLDELRHAGLLGRPPRERVLDD
jgi:hypothetical protein